MNINNNKVREAAKKYVLDSIDLSGYADVKAETDKEKLKFVVEEFNRIAIYPYNLQYHKNNYMNIFIDFIQGLPSFLNIDTENHKIIELLKSFGAEKCSERPTEISTKKFNELIYFAFYSLLFDNGLILISK